jgi:hypothetical protein
MASDQGPAGLPAELDQRDRCMVCHQPLAQEDVCLYAYGGGELLNAWSLCAACWSLLRHAIEWEVTSTPARPRDRRKRIGWERRRDTHGRFKSDP